MFSLRSHNTIDYVIGAILMVAPWLFNFADITAARDLFFWGGVTLIAYSLLTNYYYSVVKAIPLGVHMTLDALLGILLILAPALFGYRDLITDSQFAVHVVLGLTTVSLVALTKPRSEAAKSPYERAAIQTDQPLPH